MHSWYCCAFTLSSFFPSCPLSILPYCAYFAEYFICFSRQDWIWKLKNCKVKRFHWWSVTSNWKYWFIENICYCNGRDFQLNLNCLISLWNTDIEYLFWSTETAGRNIVMSGCNWVSSRYIRGFGDVGGSHSLLSEAGQNRKGIHKV